jgi:sugar phosphate isomerase/epimerase
MDDMNRRDFLQAGARAGTMAMLPALEALALPLQARPAAGYALKVLATNWGFPGDHATFCTRAKSAGYDGFEIWVPGDAKSRDELVREADRNGLGYGFLAGGSDPDYAKHAEQFKSMVNLATDAKPLYINCHSGKDHFSFDQNRALMDFTADVSARTGVPIYHETHRGRSLFAAHVARKFIEAIPSLRLTFDVSHWCNVAESLLADQAGTLAIALDRVDHIHARIGHAEGPQVNDPRAPEWDAAVKAHITWWDDIVARKKREGKLMTILTEFGPPDYLPTLPYTRQPLADQWDINLYMLNLLRKRYGT